MRRRTVASAETAQKVPKAARERGGQQRVPEAAAESSERKHRSQHWLYLLLFPQSSYWLARIAILRLLGVVYCFAFLSSLFQAPALIGSQGLMPAHLQMANLERHFGSRSAASAEVPSVFWLVDMSSEQGDLVLRSCCLLGALLGLLMAICGSANVLILATLWVLQTSLHSIGGLFFGYGWEIQLLETTFLCIFLCPLWSLAQFPRHLPTPYPVILLLRWMIFRIMLGAGLIKIRGDQCWRDLTCMNYHYETQPIPNPLSWYLHQMPAQFHMVEVAVNHLVELVLPWLLLGPRPLRHFSGLCQVGFQLALIFSGNLSFLNYLTMVPALSCFDDSALIWRLVFPAHQREEAAQAQSESAANADADDSFDASDRSPAASADIPAKQRSLRFGFGPRSLVNVLLVLLVAFLSINPVQNMLSPNQRMNSSFDRFHLVNTYGAFGSVGKTRDEVIVLGSHDGKEWREYEFKGKPGDVNRRPGVFAPYHLRVDWQIWFAAFQNFQQNPWLLHLMGKLMASDEQALSLIAHSPFPRDKPPRFMRSDLYSYKFTSWSKPGSNSTAWWRRRYLREYSPVVSVEDPNFKQWFKQMGWPLPKPPSKAKASSKANSAKSAAND